MGFRDSLLEWNFIGFSNDKFNEVRIMTNYEYVKELNINELCSLLYTFTMYEDEEVNEAKIMNWLQSKKED